MSATIIKIKDNISYIEQRKKDIRDRNRVMVKRLNLKKVGL